MSRRRASVFDDVQYQKLDQSDSGFLEVQFRTDRGQEIPWKAIILAIFLLCGGLFMLIMSSLMISGHINTKHNTKMWPLIVLGIIMFIPGAYNVRIAYYAYREYPGYSFDDIPELE